MAAFLWCNLSPHPKPVWQQREDTSSSNALSLDESSPHLNRFLASGHCRGAQHSHSGCCWRCIGSPTIAMSASLIAAARARLPEYHDGSHLVQELVGSHSLSLVRFADVASDPSKDTVRCTTRRLLVRLKIIFDYQISFFVLRDFEGFTLASAGLNLPDRDFCIEATLYMLYLAADIEHPSTLGQNEYSLHRGLTFAALLSAFRALCLHRTSFTEEEDRVIRGRVEHACQKWDAQQPLSEVEQLVFRQFIPETLQRIRARNGDCTLQAFCCGKCDEPSYLEGHVSNRTPTRTMSC